jgi:hypothetical protein
MLESTIPKSPVYHVNRKAKDLLRVFAILALIVYIDK